MKFVLRVAFLLLLVSGTLAVEEPNHEAAVHRPKRWRGFSLFDKLRGPKPTTTTTTTTTTTATTTTATKTTGGDGLGFNLADALGSDPKTSQPAGGNDFGFNLEDALRPAPKPTDHPAGGDCQGNVVQKLGTIIENQNQQLRLLLQMVARPSSARPNEKPMRMSVELLEGLYEREEDDLDDDAFQNMPEPLNPFS